MGLLVDGPGSGYDLMKRFRRSLGNVWVASQSQLYGELNRLAGTGAIEITSEGPRGRKEYALTSRGMTELRQWLAGIEGAKPQRHEMLLQVFFYGLLPREQVVQRLARQAEIAAEERAALLQLEATIDWDDGERFSSSGRLALEYGLRLRAMEEDWAHWAVAQTAGPAAGDSVGAGAGSAIRRPHRRDGTSQASGA